MRRAAPVDAGALRAGDPAAALANAIARSVGTHGGWTCGTGARWAPATEERFRVRIHRREALDRLLGALPERAFGRAYADDLLDVEPLDAFLDAISRTSFGQKASAVPSLMLAALALGARPRFGALGNAEARLKGLRTSRPPAQA